MPTPRIFISSTYRDLKDVREGIVAFVKKSEYEPVTFERNDITWGLNQSLEQSCYDEIVSCHMLVLIVRSTFGAASKSSAGLPPDKQKSVTQIEYRTAKEAGLPIFVFIDKATSDEYDAFKANNFRDDFTFQKLENRSLAMFIKEIKEESPHRYIYSYNTIEDITVALTKQWAGLFQDYLSDSRDRTKRDASQVPVNAFKFFYFRTQKGITLGQLANRTEINLSKLQKIENAGAKEKHVKMEHFCTVPLAAARRLAKALGCETGHIVAGFPDDFLTDYIVFYLQNKGAAQRKRNGGQKAVRWTPKFGPGVKL